MKYDTLEQAQADLEALKMIKANIGIMIKFCRTTKFEHERAKDRMAEFAQAIENAEHDEFTECFHRVTDAVAEMMDEAPSDASMRAWHNGRTL